MTPTALDVPESRSPTTGAPMAPRPARPPALQDLWASMRDLAGHHELLVELTKRDLRIRYTQAAMGVLWAVLTPLVVALSGWMIRFGMSYLAGAPIRAPELAGIAIKAVAWSFFTGAISFGTLSLTANLPLVTKVYFPRAILPLSAVTTQMVDTAIGAAALLVVLPLAHIGVHRTLLWVPLLLALLVLFTSGLTLIAAAGNVFYRDAKHVIQLVTSFGIFFTPVFFDAGAFGPRGTRFLLLNPLGPVFEGLRLAIVDGHPLLVPIVNAEGTVLWSAAYLGYAALWAVGLAFFGALLFRRVEFSFAEYV
ncbi:MAG: ABC transporter permease [Gemmatimonadetes bacterium]|nr:ABC transporter permease [Gemmatimonadota bacterium]